MKVVHKNAANARNRIIALSNKKLIKLLLGTRSIIDGRDGPVNGPLREARAVRIRPAF